jgi:tripartite-type tricarboxylate transporter receptor subunit TctC
MYRRRNWFFSALLSLIIVLVLLGGIRQVQSQEKYPTRAIDIIVPFGPGGSTDLVTRVLAAYVKELWGLPVNVINKPGGNTVPACLEVYGAKPDGYTLLADCSPSSTMLPAVVKNLPFKIMDRTFIASASIFHLIFMVPASSPFTSLKELEAEAKKDPENFTWASLGGAAQQDYGTRQFFKAIGVDVSKTKPVMSQSGSLAMQLTAGGHVKMGSSATGSALSGIRGGMVRPLAVTAKERFPDLPDIPTTAELGYPTLTSSQWNGVSGPPNIPPYIIEAWNKAIQKAVKDPKFIAQLRNVGSTPFYLNSYDTKEYVRKETEEVEKTYGIK